jgi:hypothetical protein
MMDMVVAVIGLVEERLPDEILKRAFQVRVNQPVNHGSGSINHHSQSPGKVRGFLRGALRGLLCA